MTNKTIGLVCGLVALSVFASACADVEGAYGSESFAVDDATDHAPKKFDVEQRLREKRQEQESGLIGKARETVPYGPSYPRMFVVPAGAGIGFTTSEVDPEMDPVAVLFKRKDGGDNLNSDGTERVGLDILALNDDAPNGGLQSELGWTNRTGQSVNVFLMIGGYGGSTGTVKVRRNDGYEYFQYTATPAILKEAYSGHVWTTNSSAYYGQLSAQRIYVFPQSFPGSAAFNDKAASGGTESDVLNIPPGRGTFIFAEGGYLAPGTTTINY